MNIHQTTKRIIDRLELSGQHWAYAAVESELIAAVVRERSNSDAVNVVTDPYDTRGHAGTWAAEELNHRQAMDDAFGNHGQG